MILDLINIALVGYIAYLVYDLRKTQSYSTEDAGTEYEEETIIAVDNITGNIGKYTVSKEEYELLQQYAQLESARKGNYVENEYTDDNDLRELIR